MTSRVYRDPTLDAVIHNDTCRSAACPRCTPAPERRRPASREEIAKSGMTTLAAIVRQRLALAVKASANAEDPVLEHGVSVTTRTHRSDS